MHNHHSLKDREILLHVVVATTMVDIHPKCGSIDELFDGMHQRNVFSWNALIAGYSQHGYVEKVLETFKKLQLVGAFGIIYNVFYIRIRHQDLLNGVP
jgi:pentatricopeptide repeat protein